MKIEQEKTNFSKLRYGLKAKIFKNSKIFEANIYLDNLYKNLLWIATNESSFIVDLSFSSISFYSLELELELKESPNHSQEVNKKYILLKELNREVPIIFDQQRKSEFSSEQNINQFIKGRKPQLFNTFETLINQNKEACRYSTNFSRYFKNMRLSLELVKPGSYTQFTETQIISALNSIEDFNSIPKGKLFESGKKISPTEVFKALKSLYCDLNSTLLKSISLATSTTNLNKFSDKKISYEQESIEEKFKKLIDLENSSKNYIVQDYKIDENLPLNDYFCFSSHNTYLTGNQITSDCKVTRYIEDLKKGIKCVELDVHNMGDDEPIITHAIKGKGFCKPINFRDTIEAMDQFLEYNKNHYPIIFSIQNHANRENQDLMNNILIKEFPKNILIPSDKNQFYKLSQIKGKIIVKTNCNLESLAQFRNNDKTSKVKSYDIHNFSKGFAMSGSELMIKQTSSTNFQNDFNTNIDNSDQMGEHDNIQYQAFLKKIKKYKDLKAKFNQRIDQHSYLPVEKIVQITCLFKAPKGVETQNPSPFECASMQNHKIDQAPVEKILNYTKKAFLRSYPDGIQIYSNNYDFLQLLNRGVQIIALNTQTNDDYAIMMNSYFRAGRTTNMTEIGYIEKPQYLRAGNSFNHPKELRSYEFTFFTNHQLELRLYSLDKAKLEEKNVMENVKRISFSLKHYNQSFLVIKIASRKWVECLPLRFLRYDNLKVYRTLIGRDYEFEDTGIRIICSFQWKKL